MELKLKPKELDAVLAGLRLLVRDMDHGNVFPNDGDIGDILTNAGQHEGLSIEEIDDLTERLN